MRARMLPALLAAGWIALGVTPAMAQAVADGVVQVQPDRPERRERPDRPHRRERPERPDRRERPERPDRPERPERPARG